jgi:hypothetical protein
MGRAHHNAFHDGLTADKSLLASFENGQHLDVRKQAQEGTEGLHGFQLHYSFRAEWKGIARFAVESANMSDSFVLGLLDGLVGAIIGAAIGAWMTTRSEEKRRKTDIALDLVGKYFEQYDDLANTLWLLDHPADLAKDPNPVLRMGDWYDTFAALIVKDMVDQPLLGALAMPEQMRMYFKKAVAAGHHNDHVRAAVEKWTNLREVAEKNGHR